MHQKVAEYRYNTDPDPHHFLLYRYLSDIYLIIIVIADTNCNIIYLVPVEQLIIKRIISVQFTLSQCHTCHTVIAVWRIRNVLIRVRNRLLFSFLFNPDPVLIRRCITNQR